MKKYRAFPVGKLDLPHNIYQQHGNILDKDKSLAKNILLQLQRLKIIQELQSYHATQPGGVIVE
jgi:hypothetical protein